MNAQRDSGTQYEILIELRLIRQMVAVSSAVVMAAVVLIASLLLCRY